LVDLIYIPIQWKKVELLHPKPDEKHTSPLNYRAESLLRIYIYIYIYIYFFSVLWKKINFVSWSWKLSPFTIVASKKAIHNLFISKEYRMQKGVLYFKFGRHWKISDTKIGLYASINEYLRVRSSLTSWPPCVRRKTYSDNFPRRRSIFWSTCSSQHLLK